MIDTDLVRIEVEDGVTILSFAAKDVNVTEAIIRDVSKAFLQVGETDPAAVIVDLSNVSFFSSSFIEVMFRLWKKVRTHEHGQFALVGLNAYCREILDVTNLTKLWNDYATRVEAVTAIKSPQ